MKSETKRLGGWDYVVAAIQLRTSKGSKQKGEKVQKKGKREPDGNIRPSTKLLLIVLANHRNHATGQCNPAHTTLMMETGLSKRTVVFELQALKALGLIYWKRGWSNDHGKMANRYALNLEAIRAEQSAPSAFSSDDEEAEQSAVGANKVQSVTNRAQFTTEQSAARAPLTSKEPPIKEPPSIEPSELRSGTALKRTDPNSEAEKSDPANFEQSAPHALSSECEQSAPHALSSEPILLTMPEVLTELPESELWILYRRNENYTLQDARDALQAYRARQATAA